MKKNALLIVLLIASNLAIGQTSKTAFKQPKLFVGIVVDQMRWDYLQRFKPLFKTTGGFNRMMNEGFSCNNTYVPYTPTVTACGHASVYTGSVPAVHGIVGNNWWDDLLDKERYCTQDDTAKALGISQEDAGKMSPRNMLTTTIGDQLKLATNFKSKVIGVAFKDRGAILPAGHSADAAYWYDKKTGQFISSNYYMPQLPQWFSGINTKATVDSFYKLGWQLAMPASVYSNYCSNDIEAYEYKTFGKEATQFPYNLTKFIDKDYSKIISTPYGNTITINMAKAAIDNENLGKDDTTDLLAISFSSPDYIGHSFGPNSWELLDCYIRLDDELGKFFKYLDNKIGVNNYTVFLTADHAVAHVPGFLQQHKLPNGIYDDTGKMREFNKMLQAKFKSNNLIVATHNYQLTLNHKAIDSLQKIDSLHIDKETIIDFLLNELKKEPAIATAFELSELAETTLTKNLKDMLVNGFFAQRCGDIQFILKPGYIDGKETGTTHGLWNNYDSHIPLLWFGNGIKQGESFTKVYMTDIAATVAALLKIQEPNGCVGNVITDLLKKNLP